MLDPPIRAELFGVERLEQHAASLASAQPVRDDPSTGRDLLNRVQDNGRALVAVHSAIAEAMRQDHWITPAAEWFLDNFFIVDEQLREIRDDLPPQYYRELPKLAAGPFEGYPRVYGIAWAFVAHTDSRFDPETLRRFVHAYQKVQPLTIGELWAVTITLRVVLVENLRRIGDLLVQARVARREADALADRLLSRDDRRVRALTEAMRRAEAGPLSTPFAVELVQRLRDQDPATTSGLTWLHQCLAAQGTSPEGIALEEHQEQAATTVTVRNIITSMRLMSALDWTEFFESVSLVDEVLGGDSHFVEMDFRSRDSYRHAVEALARRAPGTELDVAHEAVKAAALAAAGNPEDGRVTDPGYYLVGAGRRAFERTIGFRPPWKLRMGRWFIDAATPGYLGTILVLTLVVLFWPAVIAIEGGVTAGGVVLLLIAAAIPASDLAIAILNRIVTALVPPQLLPRLELRNGVPVEYRTVVVVPTMLTSVDDVAEEIDRLEVHYLANADGDIQFALLSDWPDAPKATMPGDDVLLADAREGIAELNTRHGPLASDAPRFLLLHRRRSWNPAEDAWMGWERKRGKLHEFNRLLRGATDTTFMPAPGDPGVPAGVRYVVTVDADTRLPIDVVRRLAGTMAHPLNRPRLDPGTRHVTEGYAVLQPRVTPPLPGRGGSRFQELSSGPPGVDPYAAAVSDVYQDVFGEATYAGKGIYDVDAFETSLAGRVPDNTLLSHDLFESVFARTGLVTDVEFFETPPLRYLAAAQRQHRWVRGDWQLLPWIMHEPMLPIERWKMVDNLRRSLSTPAAVVTLVLGWCWADASPLGWTVLIVASIAVPYFLPVLTGLIPRGTGLSKRSYLRALARDASLACRQSVFSLTMMAYQASLMIDAIVRTCWRLLISHRRLLQWVPAARIELASHATIATLYRRMAPALGIALIADGLMLWLHPAAWPVAVPLVILWLLSPAAAHWVSRAGVLVAPTRLSPQAATALRRTARQTWHYFATFVSPSSGALPPDNFQETPSPVIATRTSPTNIGMYLLSTVAAHDFGWIGIHEFVDRVEATLERVATLDHHRGHLYNWYDTNTGNPLEPRYVSSVDSGNLAGALIALGNACLEAVDRPVLRSLHAAEAIGDTAALVRRVAHEAYAGLPPGTPGLAKLDAGLDAIAAILRQPGLEPSEWVHLLDQLEPAAQSAFNVVRAVGTQDDLSPPVRDAILEWAVALRHAVSTHGHDADELLPWARTGSSTTVVDRRTRPALGPIPFGTTLAELPEAAGQAVAALSTSDESAALAHPPPSAPPAPANAPLPADLTMGASRITALERSAAAATALIERLRRINDTAQTMVLDMEFRFLFDPTRQLFSIGYRMTDGTLDPGRYDLLASEARLMSFIAIAKGDVPVRHWFRLGRALTPVGKDSVLVSWSGSMFEYLMPDLVMRSPAGGLLEQTRRLVVQRQIEYGNRRGVPWGVSESGYNVRNLEMTYQYSNFGIPGLGLRRGLADDVVIAPYATGLAAMVDPSAAADNFRTLAAVGARGPYGFYEAIDYTVERLPANATHAVVRMYMAHHQGMLIVAIANALGHAAMRRRFHAEPAICASELLLQERTPRGIAVARPRLDVVSDITRVREPVPPHSRRFTSPHGPTPRTHLLSNGRYAVMVTAAGGGYSRWRDLAVTRWSNDVTCDNAGTFIYLRDVTTGDFWSAGFQPTGIPAARYEAAFSEDRAEITRSDGALTTRLQVVVSSEDDAELRRVSITNTGVRSRDIEITSYAEVVLAPPAADAAHPAFSNLFIATERVTGQDTLLATRRPRSPGERAPWLAHVVAIDGETIGDLEWETDRSRFLGRDRGVRGPRALTTSEPLSKSTGPVLDPIVSLRRTVRLRPGRTAHVVFATMVAPTRDEVVNLADKYRDHSTFERAATLAWTRAQVQLHHLGISPDEADLFQTLGGSILYPDRAPRAPADVLNRQTEGTAALWAHGISGDLPIVLVQIDNADDVGIVRQLLRAHEYWRMKQLAVDLVILNDRAPSYLQDLQVMLETLVRTSQSMPHADGADERGREFVLRADHVTASQTDSLLAAARVALSSRNGTLAAQVARANRFEPVAIAAPPLAPPRAPAPPPPAAGTVAPPHAYPDLVAFNGIGGFANDGREYLIVLGPGATTPAPWINVLANPNFGALVSASGTGTTWSINSQENQLTAWSNDPVSDPPSEMMYVRDDDTGALWTPTPLPIRENDSEYVICHGHGYTRWQHKSHEVALELLQFVPVDDAVKIARLTVVNRSLRTRRLSVTAYLEWVLGRSRSGAPASVITEMDQQTGAMFARNSWSRDFSQRIAFADLGGAQTAWTGNRTEFLGRNGTTARPAALVRTRPMTGRTGAALDPCCAMQTAFELPPGGQRTIVFTVGQAATRDEARSLVQRYRTEDLNARQAEVTARWDRVLGAVEIRTPDRALDLLLNRWLLYQTLGCRLWARSAFYQASGAYGFRDQLQDVMALAVAWPEIARNQILKAASRQFGEGDVQHWWHEPVGRGVRTRISDDLLWLPYVIDHYLTVTGDRGLLDANVPFLDGPLLAPDQDESYFEPRIASGTATIFEHAARAIDHSLTKGPHGLPLMGTGDWNDGMNRVGVGGKGESVWLAWFLQSVIGAWAPIARERGETERADRWTAYADAIRGACRDHAWDGAWFRRAYFDDGTPLGSASDPECQIDSIAQSWSVLSGGADADRARQAMQAVEQKLIRSADELVLLLTPPFDHSALEPGYIKGYVPGVRENGGQYTHAATWVVFAFAAQGDGDRVGELLTMLNPIHHSATIEKALHYKVEPYVMVADVYSSPSHIGRGGWTWYTGSAAWYYRAGIEAALGFHVIGQTMRIDPCIPRAWPGYSIRYRRGDTPHEITVENPDGVSQGVRQVEVDGAPHDAGEPIPLFDDHATHRVRVVLGTAPALASETHPDAK